jgi:hypothetical protein
LLLGVVAIFMFMRNRNPATAPQDAPVTTAMFDVAVADAMPMAIDTPPTEPDAAIVVDAKPDVRDAGAKPKTDAAIATTIDAAPRATGTGTLKVGANPWGEVVIDGVSRGRTPLEVSLPAGKHVVEVIFKGEDPPRTQKKTIDLQHGETEQVDADFTKN